MLRRNHLIAVGDAHAGAFFRRPESFWRKREHKQLIIGKGKRLALTFHKQHERCRTLLGLRVFDDKQPFDVFHRHTFHELVLVRRGSGMHVTEDIS